MGSTLGISYLFLCLVFLICADTLPENCCAEDDYVSSTCRPGTDSGSPYNGADVAAWENFRRRRPISVEDELLSCKSPYTGSLSPDALAIQGSMFRAQQSMRHELDAAWALHRAYVLDHNGLLPPTQGILTVSAHPRRANKYSSCLGLGLVHQLMNLEAGIKFALLLNRTYLPWPLVQASRFTSGAPPVQLKFATVVNLQGLPVNESLPWPSPGPNVQHVHMSTDHGEARQANVSAWLANARRYSKSAPVLNIARSSKEKASANCVEYAWAAHLPGLEASASKIEGGSSRHNKAAGLPLSWSREVLAARDRILSKPPFVVPHEDDIDSHSSGSSSSSIDSRSAGDDKNRVQVPFDGVHVRGGDKRGANDPLVAVPVAVAAEVRQHLMAHLTAPQAVDASTATQRHLGNNHLHIESDFNTRTGTGSRTSLGSTRGESKADSSTMTAQSQPRLVVVATDTPDLLAGLPVVTSEPASNPKPPHDGQAEVSAKPSMQSSPSSTVPFVIFRVPPNASYLPAGWSSKTLSSTPGGHGGQPIRSGSEEEGAAVEGSALADLAVEMAILEQSERLVVSEHSNIGRRVVAARARRTAKAKEAEGQRQKEHHSSTSSTGTSVTRNKDSINGVADSNIIAGSEIAVETEEAFTVRYLYSMEVRQLLSAKVELSEWEMAVKRNDEDAVALLDAIQTMATFCAMLKDRDATAARLHREAKELKLSSRKPNHRQPPPVALSPTLEGNGAACDAS